MVAGAPDTAGEQDLRGLDIDKVSKDLFEEALIFKKEVKVESTDSRQIRWYQKTAGYITLTSPARISPIAPGARPFVAEQSWLPVTNFTIKYMLDSPMINMEDESDTEVNVFRDNAKDNSEAIANDVDSDIFDVFTENQVAVNINAVAANATWGAASGQDPFEDIMDAKIQIRQQTKRSIRNGVLLLNALGEKELLVWLVTTKGSSVPNFASEKVGTGVIDNFAGLKVVVSENVTATFAVVGDFKQAAEYRTFKPFQTVIITEPLIGRKIRSSTNGTTILVKPKFITLITGVA